MARREDFAVETATGPNGRFELPSRALALAKAHRWQAQLESGEHASLDDLALAHGVERSYVGRLLRLTSLAPDIVEAILPGDESYGISLETLRRDLPVRWDEQRERWTVIQ